MYCSILSSVVAAVALLAGPALAQTYPDPLGCAGDCFTHDPFVTKRADGTYFLFSTLDLISIRTATSLGGPWTEIGSVLEYASVANMTGNDVLWAPDVSLVGDLYYLLYAVSTSGSQDSAIGYATSTTLDPGSWTDHGALISSSSSTPYNAIDPTLARGLGDQAGQFFLSWGSYWQDIYQCAVTVDGNDAHIGLSDSPTQIAYNTPDAGSYMEGSFIYPRGGYYYLFLSVGECCTYGTPTTPPATGTPYHVNVCRSTSASGPYIDKNGTACLGGGGTTILAGHDDVYAPGGEGVFNDPTYGDVFYYHYLNTSIGLDYSQSLFGWNTINWSVDGWLSLE
ncbi:glycoside hydrolase, family 43 [Grosmannia clavigera kw1407]|uniref:Arabinan endo-1,5-alpha-L-arabinosidase n=1 Tax=Grosmannia clavigera (strain kw1407 / UAMH 11150) TaxID=655863 RepID=F0X7P7_GROCL|nr:glycoside hydrolase, family 43 [Grosmannia clavigera kw1407]EFX06629.1 glycoside hydrolase, family 43 [Grosmannia clavigera kw1407]